MYMATILLVEDDDRFRKMLAVFLRGKGYAVEQVGSGMAALPLIDECTFDLLITDYQLQDKIDGFDLLARFNQIWPGKGKIVMSGHPDIENRSDALGALHLFKPFSLDDFLAKIESVLPKHGRSVVNAATLSELINRARLQRTACVVVKERAKRQRTLSAAALSSNRKIQTDAQSLKLRMETLQRTRCFL
jgi:two-component system, cell cycle response regulator CpdR